MAGQKPDYDLSAYNRATKARGKIGAGWKNADGSITVKLNPCVVIDSDSIAMGDIAVTLWPAKFDPVAARNRAHLKAGGIGENQ